jgi:hypothetical protein
MAQLVQRPELMQAYIEVRFPGGQRDPALEAAVHRWVTRLESIVRDDVLHVDVTIGLGRRRTAVTLKLCDSLNGIGAAATSHADPYVAVSDAFRAARQQLLERDAAVMPGAALAIAR